MADADDIVRYSHADCFWLCDGSLKVYEVPHSWQNPQQIYFCTAAVNVRNRMEFARGGSIARHNQYRFKIQEAELMSIYCALHAATEVPPLACTSSTANGRTRRAQSGVQGKNI